MPDSDSSREHFIQVLKSGRKFVSKKPNAWSCGSYGSARRLLGEYWRSFLVGHTSVLLSQVSTKLLVVL